jgi:transposase
MIPIGEVVLTHQQTQELCYARDHHPKSYVRVKAAGILKVASGLSMREVALHGLLKPVAEETVRRWIDRYLREGIEGLLVKQGRGRKPAFFPSGVFC